MTELGYIIAGWAITFGVIALYAIILIRRGRSLSAEVAEDQRRWMTAEPQSGGAQ